MKVHCLENRRIGGYTTFGSVWNKGEVIKPYFFLTGKNSLSIPVQSRATAYWPDGSIRWAAHTADAGLMGKECELLPGAGNVEKGAAEKDTASQLVVAKTRKGAVIDTGKIQVDIPGLFAQEVMPTDALADGIWLDGKKRCGMVYPVMYLEHPVKEETVFERPSMGGEEALSEEWMQRTFCRGVIESVEMEEQGPLQCVIVYRGRHREYFRRGNEETCENRLIMPFVIRLYLWAGSSQMKMVHTFLFDGKEETDRLKGLGIRFDTCLEGNPWEQMAQFVTDGAHFKEPAMKLFSNYPLVGEEIFSAQLDGRIPEFTPDSDIGRAVQELPVWNRFGLYQESAYHYRIYKQTHAGCCKLSCAEGKRTDGCMAVSDLSGGMALSIRDFWQKYPSGLEIIGLGREKSSCTAWFYSPEAESFDFRHYDTRSYPRTSYEGFDEVRASAYGIGVTSECRVQFFAGQIGQEKMEDFAAYTQKPPVYVGTPEYYHDKRAFGYWSLVKQDSQKGKWLEKQLENAFSFYQNEVEARNWYGLFDYGDIMHTYDRVRHVWRYDMGGYAWQNTELVPTYWLWLYFLRTGREDVFSMAEAMSRHSSEVDTYHFGPYQGLGSRHNVRHWGCSCKEPRIAMAGHHRFLHYLTGDERLKDVFEDVKDADFSASTNIHNQMHLPDGKVLPGTRSGPDWSSYVSNWMTWYEMTLDEKYRKKIETGIKDLCETPFGLASGPDFGYDPKTGHLLYVGECETTPNQHLLICMGGPQIWLECADLLDDGRLPQLIADLGAFYYLDKEEKSARTKGKIHDRNFGWPMLATGVAAYSAMKNKDEALAKQTWQILLDEVLSQNGEEGYQPQEYAVKKDGTSLKEIAWISTNSTSQWCLNVIMCLEFIPEWLENGNEGEYVK